MASWFIFFIKHCVAYLGERRYVYRVKVWKPDEKKRSLGRRRCRL